MNIVTVGTVVAVDTVHASSQYGDSRPIPQVVEVAIEWHDGRAVVQAAADQAPHVGDLVAITMATKKA